MHCIPGRSSDSGMIGSPARARAAERRPRGWPPRGRRRGGGRRMGGATVAPESGRAERSTSGDRVECLRVGHDAPRVRVVGGQREHHPRLGRDRPTAPRRRSPRRARSRSAGSTPGGRARRRAGSPSPPLGAAALSTSREPTPARWRSGSTAIGASASTSWPDASSARLKKMWPTTSSPSMATRHSSGTCAALGAQRVDERRPRASRRRTPARARRGQRRDPQGALSGQ